MPNVRRLLQRAGRGNTCAAEQAQMKDPPLIEVGKFVLVEGMSLSFGYGEVKWADDKYDSILVDFGEQDYREFWYLRVVRRPDVAASGSRGDMRRLNKKVEALAVKRKRAVEAAEANVTEVAGEHAGQIREEIDEVRRMIEGT